MLKYDLKITHYSHFYTIMKKKKNVNNLVKLAKYDVQ